MMSEASIHRRARLDINSVKLAFADSQLSLETWIAHVLERVEHSRDPNVWITLASRAQLGARIRELSMDRAARTLPLFGVPFAVKDNIDVMGMPTSAGCHGYRYFPQVSAKSVQALLNAGAICLGKTNLDQFATGLVGTRSPWGACLNVFDPAYLAGGSSSGSAVAVAAGLVSFALGTDTAGSGRVPAALNNVVGLKPTRGLVSTHGVVPACESLDCVSVFSLCASDAALVRDLMLGETASTMPAVHPMGSFRFAVPSQLDFDGDQESARLFECSCRMLEQMGGERQPIDWTPFRALGDLLYGPFVVERLVSVGRYVQTHPMECLPVTREIILGGLRYSGSDVVRAYHELRLLRERCHQILSKVEVLITPTVPRHFRVEDDAQEPRSINDKLGIYTRFANFLDVPVLAVPAGFRTDGLPFGVSLVAAPQADRMLDALGAALHALGGAGMGRARDHAPAPMERTAAAAEMVRVAVVGAHLRGMPLHAELLSCGARFVQATRTEPAYRLFALPHTHPAKPGLLRVGDGGCAIEIELYDLPWSGLGKLMVRVAPPLAIGTLRTEQGEEVKGFLCESLGTEGAEDISPYGGFRAYVARRGTSEQLLA